MEAREAGVPRFDVTRFGSVRISVRIPPFTPTPQAKKSSQSRLELIETGTARTRIVSVPTPSLTTTHSWPVGR